MMVSQLYLSRQPKISRKGSGRICVFTLRLEIGNNRNNWQKKNLKKALENTAIGTMRTMI